MNVYIVIAAFHDEVYDEFEQYPVAVYASRVDAEAKAKDVKACDSDVAWARVFEMEVE